MSEQQRAYRVALAISERWPQLAGELAHDIAQHVVEADPSPPTAAIVEAVMTALPQVGPAGARAAALNVQIVFDAAARGVETPMSPPARASAGFWTPIPCRHPADPVAWWTRYEWLGEHHEYPLCHCGRVLNEALGHVIEGAPGPVVSCDNCGCGVAIPPKE